MTALDGHFQMMICNINVGYYIIISFKLCDLPDLGHVESRGKLGHFEQKDSVKALWRWTPGGVRDFEGCYSGWTGTWTECAIRWQGCQVST